MLTAGGADLEVRVGRFMALEPVMESTAEQGPEPGGYAPGRSSHARIHLGGNAAALRLEKRCGMHYNVVHEDRSI